MGETMKWMSCQIALYPLDTLQSESVIQRILDQIDWGELEVKVGPMSTFLRGEQELVLQKVREFYEVAALKDKVVINLTLSNHCACQNFNGENHK
jgi:uncharacterized protein YqgV (UPF0045/DUF77 family)